METAVIGAGPNAIEMSRELKHYTDRMVVINHAGVPVEPEQLMQCGKGMPFLEARIARFRHRHGQLAAIELEGGRQLEITRAFLAFPGAHVQTDLIRGFRVRLTGKGHVLVNPRTRETDHPNLWAVGDVVNHSQQVAIAMGDGAQAAIWIHKKLNSSIAP